MRKQVFLGNFTHSSSPEHLDYLSDTAMFVDDQGRIVKIDEDCKNIQEAKELMLELDWRPDEVDFHMTKEGEFYFPGFVDTHVHAPQYPNVGIFGNSTLMDWLEEYTFPLEASLSDLKKARRVYTACIRRSLAHGTTTSSYFATIDVAATNLLADLCLSLGQRAFVGRVCMDYQPMCKDYYCDESAQDGLDKTRQTISHVRKIDPNFELVSPILTPRFGPTCTAESLKGLGAMQREMDLPVQTHVSENEGEIALVAELFPDSTSYTGVYDDCGLLTPRTVLAHAVHISEEEADLIARRGSKVSHCPCSNSSLTSGEARVRWMWDRGIVVGLGTDMSGGYSPSILEAARQAILVSRHVAMRAPPGPERERSKLTVEEVLWMATRGGAAVLGLEDKIGAFKEGMDWDAQLIRVAGVDEKGISFGDDEDGDEDPGNVDCFEWETKSESTAKWLFGGDDRNTKKVWVKGRLVHSRRGMWS